MTAPAEKPKAPSAPLSLAGRYEVRLLAGLLLVGASVWVFIEIGGRVSEGSAPAFDEKLLLAMREPEDPSEPLGPHWVEELSRDLTSLGSGGVLILITLAAAAYLALQGKTRIMLFLFAAVFGGMILSLVLKDLFARPRPDLISKEALPLTLSFPSGHSMSAAVVYLTLGALLARVQPLFRLKAYLLSLAVLITITVGLTRIYLGVHWPTDVLAGWTAGAGWALICWIVALILQKRGKVERVASEKPPAS
jgi:undecaprenyl-diphosphatase